VDCLHGGAGRRGRRERLPPVPQRLRPRPANRGTLQLAAERDEPTRNLAYGKQRLLEIALALATKPHILLLDEPAAGIPAGESAELFGVLANLPRDVTVLFIEHDMDLVFRFAERITVMVAGSVLTEGTPAEIAADPRVKEVYLGEAQHG
jgi:branched-chain amino acid transport system ATP-binding protein